MDRGDLQGSGSEVSDSWSAAASPGQARVTPRRTRRVAILGFAETVKDAPWGDPSWELWAMNGWWRAAKPDFGIDVPEDRYSLWFDTHTLEYTRAYGISAGFGDAQERWLEQEHPFPVVMLEQYPQFPASVRYPVEQVVAKMGREYFTSTIAYALAFAAMQDDVAEIGLWGVDLVHDTEYADQRPCAEYWIGRAEALGIKVTVHDRSALLKQRVRYGLEAESELLNDLTTAIRQSVALVEKRIAELRDQNERAIAELHTQDGASQFGRTLLNRLEMYRRGGRL